MRRELVITGNFRIDDIQQTNPDLQRLITCLEEAVHFNKHHYFFIGFEDQLSDDRLEIFHAFEQKKLGFKIVDNMLVVTVGDAKDLNGVISIWACYSGGGELYALVRTELEPETFPNDLESFLRTGRFLKSEIIARDTGDGDVDSFVILG